MDNEIALRHDHSKALTSTSEYKHGSVEHKLLGALGEAAQEAAEMDMLLAQWAMDYGFAKAPQESGSMFLSRFCRYLSQMYFGMYNPGELPRICTCHENTDYEDGTQFDGHFVFHDFPCELSSEAKRRRGEC